jgi:hypothetical protein
VLHQERPTGNGKGQRGAITSSSSSSSKQWHLPRSNVAQNCHLANRILSKSCQPILPSNPTLKLFFSMPTGNNGAGKTKITTSTNIYL